VGARSAAWRDPRRDLEIIGIHDARSLADGYNRGIAQSRGEHIILSHDDIEIRAGLSSPFDDAAVDGFRWPLHPLDDIDRIVSSMTGLMRECRVNNVYCVERVLPAFNTRGTVWFLTDANHHHNRRNDYRQIGNSLATDF
jgi:hypothetical protein